MRQKSHQAKVQEHLDEGAGKGWLLISATTTNAAGSYVTGIYWDTTPERKRVAREQRRPKGSEEPRRLETSPQYGETDSSMKE